MYFDFFMPTKIISGENAISKNSSVFLDFGKKALIVTGKSSAVKSGALNDVLNALKLNNIDYILYDKIEQNPMLSTCFEGAKLANENEVDFVIGIGGGSALDASKAVSIFATNKDLQADDIFLRSFANKPLPLIVVGTTAGTGSEVSAVSVLTQDKTMNKKSVVHPFCYATLAFCDPRYTYSMDYATTVSTALDAFSHTTEGWFSPNCNEVISLFAKKAFTLIFDSLKELNENKCVPNEETRKNLFYGSLYAGMVLNHTGTAYPHPMGYILSEKYNVPHGKACCAFLPSLIERAQMTENDKFNELCNILSTDCKYLCDLISSLADVKNIKMSLDEIESYSPRFVALKNYDNTPGGFNETLANNLMKKLFLKEEK